MNKGNNWSEYWANEGVSGEVFVDKKGNKHPYLSKFWNQYLSQVTKNAKVVDLACGGGSIFADNVEDGQFQLYAVDISAQALTQLNKRLPEVTTIESSVDEIPLDSGMFDLVVSQFGIEYVGESAFVEAARLMASGSQLVVLCHIENGFIDTKNQTELEGAKLLESTDFIEKAIAVTTANFNNDTEAYKKKLVEFIAIEPQVATWLEGKGKSLVSHCYLGFRQMYERKNVYQLSDIIGWLEGMKSEVGKTIIRVSEMRKAAQSEKQVKSICEALVANGLSDILFKPFTLPEQKLPIAWCITGNKK
jgi:ubiquinone/menaquinone biosynthesis C-methylase UbiE